MHASFALSALFAASALAKPLHAAHKQLHNKRDMAVETHFETVYATQVVTQYAGGYTPAPDTPTPMEYTVIETQTPAAPQYTPESSAPAPAYTPAPKHHPSSSAPAPAQSSPASYQPGSPVPENDYQAIVLMHHNIHRKNHSAPPLEWDDELASIAQSEAEVCIYAHNVTGGGGGYGQNIAAGVAPNNISAVITGLFYNGEVGYYDGQYGLANPDMTNFESFGHFTQLVWKATTHVACATVQCSQGLGGLEGGDIEPYFTVCNYRCEGNFGGEYGTNIGQSVGMETVEWNYGIST